MLCVDVPILPSSIRYWRPGGVHLEVGNPVNIPCLPALHPAQL